jgi:hypothetical protein
VTYLRVIGHWRNDEHPELPDPVDLVDADWDRREKSHVYWYVSGGTHGRAYMGYSTCRICGVQNGAGELSDGTYVWPEGLAHYLQEHDVRLPNEFVRHALQRSREIEEDPRDEGWWLETAALAKPAGDDHGASPGAHHE